MEATVPPFSSLRMSPAEFEAYRHTSILETTYKIATDVQEGGRPVPKVKVIGYNDEAKLAIKASHDDGRESVEVPWSRLDSIVSNGVIMTRGVTNVINVTPDVDYATS